MSSSNPVTMNNKPISGPDNCEAKCNKVAIEITICDENNDPIPNQNVELKNSSNQSITNITNRQGTVRFDGLEEGEFLFSMQRMDGNLWSVEKKEVLAAGKKASNGIAGWEPSKEPDTASKQHIAELNDCFTSIAAMHGFDPESLWNHPANEEIRKKRDSMNILAEGDVVNIPEKPVKWEKMETGNRYTIKKQNLMSKVHIQLLDMSGNKRPNVKYLFSITTRSCDVVPDREGTTDSEGFLLEPIPPDTDTVCVIIIDNGCEDRYDLKVGSLEPFDTLKGKQQRLRNLGFHCEYEEEEGVTTLEAVKGFQERYGLEVSGKICEETVKRLRKLSVS